MTRDLILETRKRTEDVELDTKDRVRHLFPRPGPSSCIQEEMTRKKGLIGCGDV